MALNVVLDSAIYKRRVDADRLLGPYKNPPSRGKSKTCLSEMAYYYDLGSRIYISKNLHKAG
jgi:hypothetical protein